MKETMFEATANDFPFVDELPKREKKKVLNVWDQLAEMRKVIDEKGVLIPPVMVAKLLGLTRQRIYQFMQEGRFETVEFNGQMFITENSIVEFAKTERKTGRPFNVTMPTFKEVHSMVKQNMRKK